MITSWDRCRGQTRPTSLWHGWSGFRPERTLCCVVVAMIPQLLITVKWWVYFISLLYAVFCQISFTFKLCKYSNGLIKVYILHFFVSWLWIIYLLIWFIDYICLIKFVIVLYWTQININKCSFNFLVYFIQSKQESFRQRIWSSRAASL